jgi:hypothetical protein
VSPAPSPRDGGAGARGGRIHTTPAGRRFEVLAGGETGPEDIEVLAAAIDRHATFLHEQQLGPWTTARRPGIGARAWEPGRRWALKDRADWGGQL